MCRSARAIRALATCTVPGSSGCRSGLQAGIYDVETGLLRFGARDYDPMIGRWVGKDPIRFGGLQANIYVYVGNDPVNRSDPLGLYGTNDCSYYAERCAENGGSYYCQDAPWWCDAFPKLDDPDPSNEFDDEGFFRCTRQCLQDRDRSRNPSRNQCGSEEPNDSGPWNPWNPSWTDHVVCYHECFADNYLQ